MQLCCPHCKGLCDRALQTFGKPETRINDDSLFLVVCLHCAHILVLERDALRRPTALEWDAVINNPPLFRELKNLQHNVELFIYDTGPGSRPN
jgi:hypothetical protein